MLVACYAGNGSLAADIGARERLDHLLAKALFVVEHVVGDAEARGDVARVMDVLSGAACALAVRRIGMVVELHGQADDVVAPVGEQRRDDRRIDSPRHRHDDAGVLGRLVEAEATGRGA